MHARRRPVQAVPDDAEREARTSRSMEGEEEAWLVQKGGGWRQLEQESGSDSILACPLCVPPPRSTHPGVTRARCATHQVTVLSRGRLASQTQRCGAGRLRNGALRPPAMGSCCALGLRPQA